MVTCSFEGCDKPVAVKKWMLCRGHYNQKWRGVELRPLKVKYKRPSPDTKICTGCLKVKHNSEYYLNNHGFVRGKCKVCIIAEVQAYKKAKAAENEAETGPATAELNSVEDSSNTINERELERSN